MARNLLFLLKQTEKMAHMLPEICANHCAGGT